MTCSSLPSSACVPGSSSRRLWRWLCSWAARCSKRTGWSRSLPSPQSSLPTPHASATQLWLAPQRSSRQPESLPSVSSGLATPWPAMTARSASSGPRSATYAGNLARGVRRRLHVLVTLLSTSCATASPPVVAPPPELLTLAASGRAIPTELLSCDPFPPIPDGTEDRAQWLLDAVILHELCVIRAAAARALQRGD